MFLQQHEIENFPVNHLSYSAIRQYLSDRQMFFKRYIRLEFDDKKGPALIEGSFYHAMLEAYWNSVKAGKKDKNFFDVDVWNEQIALIDKDEKAGLIDWGVKGSKENSIDTVKKALEFYYAEVNKIAYKEVLDAEAKFLADFEDLDGNPMPIALKGFMDLNLMCEEGLVGRDHKLVSYFTKIDEVNPGYEIQACVYWFLARKRYGANLQKMVFDELKKTKNRDDSPQLQSYVVEFTPLLLNKFLELYRRIVCELAGKPLIQDGIAQFIPNPFAQFGGEDSWKDFGDEIEGNKRWNLSEFRKNRYDLADVEALDL